MAAIRFGDVKKISAAAFIDLYRVEFAGVHRVFGAIYPDGFRWNYGLPVTFVNLKPG
jgi:hypothetical protein